MNAHDNLESFFTLDLAEIKEQKNHDRDNEVRAIAYEAKRYVNLTLQEKDEELVGTLGVEYFLKTIVTAENQSVDARIKAIQEHIDSYGGLFSLSIGTANARKIYFLMSIHEATQGYLNASAAEKDNAYTRLQQKIKSAENDLEINLNKYSAPKRYIESLAAVGHLGGVGEKLFDQYRGPASALEQTAKRQADLKWKREINSLTEKHISQLVINVLTADKQDKKRTMQELQAVLYSRQDFLNKKEAIYAAIGRDDISEEQVNLLFHEMEKINLLVELDDTMTMLFQSMDGKFVDDKYTEQNQRYAAIIELQFSRLAAMKKEHKEDVEFSNDWQIGQLAGKLEIAIRTCVEDVSKIVGNDEAQSHARLRAKHFIRSLLVCGLSVNAIIANILGSEEGREARIKELYRIAEQFDDADPLKKQFFIQLHTEFLKISDISLRQAFNDYTSLSASINKAALAEVILSHENVHELDLSADMLAEMLLHIDDKIKAQEIIKKIESAQKEKVVRKEQVLRKSEIKEEDIPEILRQREFVGKEEKIADKMAALQDQDVQEVMEFCDRVVGALMTLNAQAARREDSHLSRENQERQFNELNKTTKDMRSITEKIKEENKFSSMEGCILSDAAQKNLQNSVTYAMFLLEDTEQKLKKRNNSFSHSSEVVSAIEEQERQGNNAGRLRDNSLYNIHLLLVKREQLTEMLRNIESTLINVGGQWEKAIDRVIAVDQPLAAQVYGGSAEHKKEYFGRFIFQVDDQEKANKAVGQLYREGGKEEDIYELFSLAEEFYTRPAKPAEVAALDDEKKEDRIIFSNRAGYLAVAILKQPNMINWLLQGENEKFQAVMRQANQLFIKKELHNRTFNLFEHWTVDQFKNALEKTDPEHAWWMVWGALTNKGMVASLSPEEKQSLLTKLNFTQMSPEHIRQLDKSVRIAFLQQVESWEKCRKTLIDNPLDKEGLRDKVEALRDGFDAADFEALKESEAGLVVSFTQENVKRIVREVHSGLDRKKSKKLGYQLIEELDHGFLSLDAALLHKVHTEKENAYDLVGGTYRGHLVQSCGYDYYGPEVDGYTLKMNAFIREEIRENPKNSFEHSKKFFIHAMLSDSETVDMLDSLPKNAMDDLGDAAWTVAAGMMNFVGSVVGLAGKAAAAVGVGAAAVGVGVVNPALIGLGAAGALAGAGVAVGGGAVAAQGRQWQGAIGWDTHLGYGLMKAAQSDKLSALELLDCVNQLERNPDSQFKLINALPLFFSQCDIKGDENKQAAIALLKIIAEKAPNKIVYASQALAQNPRLDSSVKSELRAILCFTNPQILNTDLVVFNKNRSIPGLFRKVVSHPLFIMLATAAVIAAAILIPGVGPMIGAAAGAATAFGLKAITDHPFLTGIGALVGLGAAKVARDQYKAEKKARQEQFDFIKSGFNHQIGSAEKLKDLLKAEPSLRENLGKSLALCKEHGHGIGGKDKKGKYHIDDPSLRRELKLLRQEYYYKEHRTWAVLKSIMTLGLGGSYRVNKRLKKAGLDLAALAAEMESEASIKVNRQADVSPDSTRVVNRRLAVDGDAPAPLAQVHNDGAVYPPLFPPAEVVPVADNKPESPRQQLPPPVAR